VLPGKPKSFRNYIVCQVGVALGKDESYRRCQCHLLGVGVHSVTVSRQLGRSEPVLVPCFIISLKMSGVEQSLFFSRAMVVHSGFPVMYKVALSVSFVSDMPSIAARKTSLL